MEISSRLAPSAANDRLTSAAVLQCRKPRRWPLKQRSISFGGSGFDNWGRDSPLWLSPQTVLARYAGRVYGSARQLGAPPPGTPRAHLLGTHLEGNGDEDDDHNGDNAHAHATTT